MNFGENSAVTAEEDDVFHAGHVGRLVDDEAALVDEDREVQQFRAALGHVGQDLDHVGLAVVHGRGQGDLATQSLELVGEDAHQRLRVDGAVVDGRGLGHAQLVGHEVGHDRALEGVAPGRAQEAVEASVAVRQCQRR